MPYYFYNQKYQNLPAWGSIYAGKILEKSNKEMLKLNIIDSHHIELKSDKFEGFTEILSEQIPMSILSQSVEFELIPNLKLEGSNYKIYITDFSLKDADKFLNSKDIIFFTREKDSWIILKWKLTDHKAEFWSLKTLPKQKLCLWTESHYEI